MLSVLDVLLCSLLYLFHRFIDASFSLVFSIVVDNHCHCP